MKVCCPLRHSGRARHADLLAPLNPNGLRLAPLGNGRVYAVQVAVVSVHGRAVDCMLDPYGVALPGCTVAARIAVGGSHHIETLPSARIALAQYIIDAAVQRAPAIYKALLDDDGRVGERK